MFAVMFIIESFNNFATLFLIHTAPFPRAFWFVAMLLSTKQATVTSLFIPHLDWSWVSGMNVQLHLLAVQIFTAPMSSTRKFMQSGAATFVASQLSTLKELLKKSEMVVHNYVDDMLFFAIKSKSWLFIE